MTVAYPTRLSASGPSTLLETTSPAQVGADSRGPASVDEVFTVRIESETVVVDVGGPGHETDPPGPDTGR
jgi:hypothetical protein